MNRRWTQLVPMAVIIATVASLAAPARAQTEPFDILLTNDDGIESTGIQALAEALGAVGRVHLVAPCGERSGASMSVALRDELELRPVERDGEILGHCVDTTPAGAVILAITALAPEEGYDLVVSGINRGANVGAASHMSGTVGGAMAGALYGLPAVAASLGGGADFDYAARFVAGFVADMKQRPALPGVVLSINLPRATEEETSGVLVAPMGNNYLTFAYQEQEPGADGRRFRPRIGLATSFADGSDTEAFMNGMITITPLRFDWTAHDMIEQLRQWGVTHELSR